MSDFHNLPASMLTKPSVAQPASQLTTSTIAFNFAKHVPRPSVPDARARLSAPKTEEPSLKGEEYNATGLVPKTLASDEDGDHHDEDDCITCRYCDRMFSRSEKKAAERHVLGSHTREIKSALRQYRGAGRMR